MITIEHIEKINILPKIKNRFNHLILNASINFDDAIHLAIKFINEHPNVEEGNQVGHREYHNWLDEQEERYEKFVNEKEDEYNRWKETEEGHDIYKNWVILKRDEYDNYLKQLRDEYEIWKNDIENGNYSDSIIELKKKDPNIFQEWYNKNIEKKEEDIKFTEENYNEWLNIRELIELKKIPNFKNWERKGNERDGKEKIALDIVINYMYKRGIKF
jgi:hypothetical protein